MKICANFFSLFLDYLLDKNLKRSIIITIPNPRPPRGRASLPHLCTSIASAYHKKVKIMLISGKFFSKKFSFVNEKLTFLWYFFPSLTPTRLLGGSCSLPHL
ncbi:MAG: hypothetical protein LBP31_02075, partial [Holosporales bacterium]|nr:hypothetical protein [Holosporales bacterium]